MFSCIHSLEKFASIQASIDKFINSQTLLSRRSIFKLNRDAACTEWCLSLILYERVYQSALMPRLFCLKAPNLEHSLTSRSNFKLNRAAALAEWRQLLAG